jgi:hypothetical protein
MAQKRLIAGLLWSLGHLHSSEALTRVPTQVTCRIFKKRPGRKGPGGVPSKGGRSISAYRLPSTPFLGSFRCAWWLSPQAPINSRARSIAKLFGLSTRCHKIIIGWARGTRKGRKKQLFDRARRDCGGPRSRAGGGFADTRMRRPTGAAVVVSQPNLHRGWPHRADPAGPSNAAAAVRLARPVTGLFIAAVRGVSKPLAPRIREQA